MTLTTAVSDLFQSIYELFASVLSTIYAVIHAAFSTVWNFIASILSLVQSIVREAVHLTGGVGKFVASKSLGLVVISRAGIDAILFVFYPTCLYFRGKGLKLTVFR